MNRLVDLGGTVGQFKPDEDVPSALLNRILDSRGNTDNPFRSLGFLLY